MPHPSETLDTQETFRSPVSVLRFEPTSRRIRAILGGTIIADSTDAQLVLEGNGIPVVYFPMDDVRMDLLEPTDRRTHCRHKGEASYWSIRAGETFAKTAAWSYKSPISQAEAIRDHVAFYWDKMDSWYEEDDEVFAHPRHPFHRVDVLHSSRHIRVAVKGETVAETTRPRLLFETLLPTRYYMPKLDVRMEMLQPSETVTRCPYKGKASYFDVVVGGEVLKDLVWVYEAPIPECPKIANLFCFLNEKVEIYVDGELSEVPSTRWS
ncbi:MAG: DUF427 domain-containing protein [Actinobacteria bacterium]|nr:DUF427 domain-containing protein [Actinomycetota bacterium]